MKRLYILIPLCLVSLAACSNQVTKSTANPTSEKPVQVSQAPPATVAVKTMAQADQDRLADQADKIFPGVTIQGVDVGNLSREEAEEKIQEELLDPIKDRKVRFTYANQKDFMTFKRLKVAMDPKVLDEAMAYGHDLSPEEQLELLNNPKEKDIPGKLTYDEKRVQDNVDNAARRIHDFSIQKSAERIKGKVSVKPDFKHQVLDKEAYKAEIVKNINFKTKNNKYIEPILKEGKLPYDPEELKKITGKLASATTRYKNSSDGRKFNVKLAADFIDGSLLLPGQELSFNQSIGGGAGSQNGFQDAGVIVGKELVQEPGGGVCQVSSTLYRSILDAGLSPTERSNHGMTIGYLPAGLDAVVYAPHLDLKFKNTFDSPIYLRTKADGQELTISIYGNEEEMAGLSYEYETEVYEEDPAEITEEEDDSIPSGAIVLDPSPKDGQKVRVYRITLKDGQEVDRKMISDNEYRRSDGVRRYGTGKASQVADDWYLNRKVEKFPDGYDGPRK